MSRMVTLNVKSDKIMKTFKVDGRANIKFFKTKIAPEFGNPPVPQLCLIFSGKIMKDNETLDTHNIKDNQTIHLVVKTGTPQAVDPRKPTDIRRPVDPRKPTDGNKQVDSRRLVDPRQAVDAKPKGDSLEKEDGSKIPSSKPTTEKKPSIDPAQVLFGLEGIYSLPSMARMGLGSVNYKELQQQMKDGIKSNPELFKKHLESPFTQSLMANPEIMRTLILSNPQTKQVLESNPTVYEMLNNPSVLRLTRETGKSPEMIQNLISKIDNDNLESANKPEKEKNNNIKRKYSQRENVFWNNKMPSLLQSMYGNQQLIENMTKVPQFSHSIFETMLENPALSSKVLLNIPIFSDNPEIQKSMKAMIPAFLQQLQKPELMQLMSGETGVNALKAINKIQTSLQRLDMVTPDLHEVMGMSKLGAGINILTSTEDSDDKMEEKEDDDNKEDDNEKDNKVNANDDKIENTIVDKKEEKDDEKSIKDLNEGIDSYRELMSKVIKRMAEKGLDAAPEQKFETELKFMEEMGFNDKQTNIQSLIVSCGDMHGALQSIEAKNLAKRQRS